MSISRHRARLLLLLGAVATLGLCLGPWFGPPRGSGARTPSEARPDTNGPAEPALESAQSDLSGRSAAREVGEPDVSPAGPVPTSPPPVVGIVLDAAGSGIAGAEPERIVELREMLQELLQVSSPGFPATTLGL